MRRLPGQIRGTKDADRVRTTRMRPSRGTRVTRSALAFTALVSHYLFQERFGRPGKRNDKGKVEALVKYSRANFLTPVPHAASFEALNAMLEERCRARQNERAGHHEKTIGERLSRIKRSCALCPRNPSSLVTSARPRPCWCAIA
jgi:transposase